VCTCEDEQEEQESARGGPGLELHRYVRCQWREFADDVDGRPAGEDEEEERLVVIVDGAEGEAGTWRAPPATCDAGRRTRVK
jgi:hypothetical protein